MLNRFLKLTEILLAVLGVPATSDIRASGNLYMAFFTAIVQGIPCAASGIQASTKNRKRVMIYEPKAYLAYK